MQKTLALILAALTFVLAGCSKDDIYVRLHDVTITSVDLANAQNKASFCSGSGTLTLNIVGKETHCPSNASCWDESFSTNGNCSQFVVTFEHKDNLYSYEANVGTMADNCQAKLNKALTFGFAEGYVTRKDGRMSQAFRFKIECP